MIRELMLRYGEVSPADVYSIVKKFKKKASYMSILKLFKYAEKLGLIRRAREVTISQYRRRRIIRFKKVYYRIVEEKINDPAWNNIFASLYPNASLGRRYYVGKTVYFVIVNGKIYGMYLDREKAENIVEKLRDFGVSAEIIETEYYR
jgi:hypothetical protein